MKTEHIDSLQSLSGLLNNNFNYGQYQDAVKLVTSLSEQAEMYQSYELEQNQLDRSMNRSK